MVKTPPQFVMQFGVYLRDINPEIWRRIQVPATFTFWELHAAIQDAMGWEDKHLHRFTVKRRVIGSEVHFGFPDQFRPSDLPSWQHKIAGYFRSPGDSATYWYDFGGDWHHVLTLEAIVPEQSDVRYPVCVEGARACPPEYCCGLHGYRALIAAMADPQDKTALKSLKWLKSDFKSEVFQSSAVEFSNPAQRLDAKLRQLYTHMEDWAGPADRSAADFLTR